MLLEQNETVEVKILHKKQIPFYLVDWMRMLCFIGVSIAGVASIRSEGIISVGTVLIGAGIYYIILPLFVRWYEVSNTFYCITNKRVIFYDLNERLIKHSFYFDNFPPIIFHENAYDYGFITIGVVEPVIQTKKRLGLPRTGVNLVNSEFVIYNLPNVRKVFNEITSRVIDKTK